MNSTDSSPDSTGSCFECARRLVHSCASISADGSYRWQLRRRWAEEGRIALWVMLNPSTANGVDDDATIRRCINFSKGWGLAGLAVANLFALRARHPNALMVHPDPVGGQTDSVLTSLSSEASLIIVAWGAHPVAKSRIKDVQNIIGVKVKCLGVTQAGHPRHPFYLSRKSKLVAWLGRR
jgi:hypothetical protein